jgi:DNA polymerase-3 subunit delta
MFLLIYGDDTFRSRRTLIATRQRFLAQRDPTGLNMVTLAGGYSGVDVLRELASAPFLSEKRMVVIEDFLEKDEQDQAQVADVLGHLPESTVAVFFEGGGTKALAKSPLFPLLRTQKYSIIHEPLSPFQAEAFVMQESAASGTTFAAGAARALVTAVGAESARLHAECGKLSAYALSQERTEITVGDVRLMVAGEEEVPIFEFVDAILSGNPRVAALAVARAERLGIVAPQLLHLLERQLRLLIQAKGAAATGMDPAAFVTAAGVHPFAAKKAYAAAKKYAQEPLVRRHASLVDIDKAFKSGEGQILPMLLVSFAKG